METLCAFLLLVVGSALTSPVENSKESLLYPYGTDQGDTKNPKSDDGTSPEITISVPFSFYGKEYRSLYVNNNGVVSFGVNVSQYTPDPFPLDGGCPFVAPYWGDVDNRMGGDVFWRQTQDPEVLGRCTADINKYFSWIPFTASWAFIATWDHVAYFGSASKKVNTFQAVLTTNGDISFIMLNYADIQWTTGRASGGNAHTGLGGTPAQEGVCVSSHGRLLVTPYCVQGKRPSEVVGHCLPLQINPGLRWGSPIQVQAGFDSGDKINYYNIPSSRTPEVLNIGGTTNVGVPGRWVFQVDEFVAPATTESIDCLL